MKSGIGGLPYRKRLVNELISRQRRNPAYSLRSFARDLEVSPTALSQALSAKRNLSKGNLLKVTEKLGFTPSERSHALKELSGTSCPIDDNQFTTLQDDVFHFLSDWYYFALLCLAETGKAKAEPDWIAECFAISPLEARDACERLLRLGLVTVRDGLLCYEGAQLKTTTDVPSAAARKLQQDHLRLAALSLERDPLDCRDMTSMTMAIRPERIPKAKAMIKTFRRRLARFLEAGGGEEVYVAAIQLFPVASEGKK